MPLSGDRPLVTVIVPTFNRPALLAEALQSILDQRFPSFEAVVVNDGGADVEGVVQAFGSDRLRTIRHPTNRGLAAARNTGVRAARGRFIAYLDDDDRFYPEHLATLVGFLGGEAGDVVYSDACRVVRAPAAEGGRVIRRDVPYAFDFDRERLLVDNFIPVLCFLHSREAFEEAGGFDESLSSHEDWDLWVRMSRRRRFRHIRRVTCEFRWSVDGGTMTSAGQRDFLRTARRIYDKIRHAEHPDREIVQKQEAALAARRFRLHGTAPAVPVSIVIPLHNHREVTARCLKALLANTPAPLFELILVDNASTDGTAELLRQVRHPRRIITNPRNLGYTLACNQGAAAARGKYIALLNNDTEPRPGWLESLLAVVESDWLVGAVGSKLLYPSGELQEAGALILPDGANRCVGNRDDPDKPEYNRFCEVDYCSGASLLVRRDLWLEIGGFDPRYAPAYYEDPDLCFALREHGYKTVYCPRSVVVHHESVTAGRDAGSGVKRHYWINRRRFRDKWAEVLKGRTPHRAPYDPPARAWASRPLPARRDDAAPPIVIDGVVFQAEAGPPRGAGRMWRVLLTALAAGPLAGRLLLLDRAGTAPDLPGLSRIPVPAYRAGSAAVEARALDAFCRGKRPAWFVSTGFTATTETPLFLMLPDRFPERGVDGSGTPSAALRDQRFAIEHAAAFGAVSAATAADLLRVHPQAGTKPVAIIPWAAGEAFTPRPAAEVAAFRRAFGLDKPYFLLAGGGEDPADRDLFFEALARLPSGARYAVIAAGVDLRCADAFRLQAAGARVLAGVLSDEELARLYTGAAALVYPGRGEGFPVPVVEAMRCGCPVIACRTAALLEVAGAAALYIDPNDPSELAAALRGLEDPRVRAACARRGIEHAGVYGGAESAERLLGAIREFAGTGAATGRSAWRPAGPAGLGGGAAAPAEAAS
jgi:GT2 family glycosyltransferase